MPIGVRSTTKYKFRQGQGRLSSYSSSNRGSRSPYALWAMVSTWDYGSISFEAKESRVFLKEKLKHTHRALALPSIHLPQSYLRSPSVQPLEPHAHRRRGRGGASRACAPLRRRSRGDAGRCRGRCRGRRWATLGEQRGRRGTRARLHADAGRGARAARLAAGRAPPRGVATGGAATDSATS